MTEHDFQCNIVRTLRMQNIFVFSVPNGQSLLSRIPFNHRFAFMAYLKREGLMKGTSDLIVIYNGKLYFVEIKKPADVRISKTGKQVKVRAGVQSEEQRQFQKEVEAQGFQYVLIDSYKKFEEFLSEVKK